MSKCKCPYKPLVQYFIPLHLTCHKVEVCSMVF